MVRADPVVFGSKKDGYVVSRLADVVTPALEVHDRSVDTLRRDVLHVAPASDPCVDDTLVSVVEASISPADLPYPRLG